MRQSDRYKFAGTVGAWLLASGALLSFSAVVAYGLFYIESFALVVFSTACLGSGGLLTFLRAQEITSGVEVYPRAHDKSLVDSKSEAAELPVSDVSP